VAGCQNIQNNLACDDKNACTQGDYCAAGICLSGKVVTCDDGNLCTDDYCDKAKGCQTKPNAKTCEDGDPCTKDDACSGGQCVSGLLMDCDDGKPCTQDTCDFTKCIHSPVDGACSDSDPCTVNDKCNNGLCLGTLIANCGCHSLALNGSTGYGEVPYSTLLNLSTNFTVEAWVKLSVDGAYALLSRWGETSKSFLFLIESNGTVKFRMASGDAGKETEVKKALQSTSGWHHVAAVHSNGTLSLYLDGVLADSLPNVPGMVSTTLPLFIGAPQITPGGGNPGFLKGNIDEVRISKAALYTAPFQPKKSLSVEPPITIAYWGADQDQFPVLFDESSNYLHAALKGGASWSNDTPETVCTPVPNFPPSTPTISIQPPNPADNNDLTCSIDKVAEDKEKDPITYSFKWYVNGAAAPQFTTATIPASATSDCPHWKCDQCQKWTCQVTASDGKPGLPASASATVGQTTCKTCNGSLFADHCYSFNNWTTGWGAASQSCQQWGGHMVTISSAEENGYVDGLCPGACWIGLTDQVQEGTMVWVTGQPLGDNEYNNWSWGEPNNGWPIGDEDCVHMYGGGGGSPSGRWNDLSCSGQLAFTCEMEP